MIIEKRYFENLLIFGSGPVALHLFILLSNFNCSNLGIKIRRSSNSEKLKVELQKEENCIEVLNQIEISKLAYGKMKLENILEEDSEILNEWETFILATPCDVYLEVLKNIPLKKLNKLKVIVLISPELGSSLFLKNFLKKIGREDIEVISFSNYFGAANFKKNSKVKIELNGLKEKIYISSTQIKSIYIEKWRSLLSEIGINPIIALNNLEAESRNITIFVHSPFLLNVTSLNQVFLKDKQKRYLYKLFPEGPITKYVISDMVVLYHEIMELYKKLKISEINLLQFLNESYPVLENSIHLHEINEFKEKSNLEQEYLLYVRYASILIDPFSKPDEEGNYFDFSRVEYSKVFQNEDKKWVIPRRPLEDFNKLNLIYCLSKLYGTKNKTMETLLKIYKEFYEEFSKEVLVENIAKNSLIITREKDAQLIYNELER